MARTDQPTRDELLDAPCWSAREVLELIGLVWSTRPRDGLRVLEDSALDMVNR